MQQQMVKLLRALWKKYSPITTIDMPPVACYCNIWYYTMLITNDCGVYLINNMKLLVHLQNPSNQLGSLELYRNIIKWEIFTQQLLPNAYGEPDHYGSVSISHKPASMHSSMEEKTNSPTNQLQIPPSQYVADTHFKLTDLDTRSKMKPINMSDSDDDHSFSMYHSISKRRFSVQQVDLKLYASYLSHCIQTYILLFDHRNF